jgi:hypothetical protein
VAEVARWVDLIDSSPEELLIDEIAERYLDLVDDLNDENDEIDVSSPRSDRWRSSPAPAGTRAVWVEHLLGDESLAALAL